MDQLWSDARDALAKVLAAASSAEANSAEAAAQAGKMQQLWVQMQACPDRLCVCVHCGHIVGA